MSVSRATSSVCPRVYRGNSACRQVSLHSTRVCRCVCIVLGVMERRWWVGTRIMTVHLICLRSDVLLRFALFHFICIFLTLVMLNCLDSPISFFNCGIRVTQKASFHFMHLL